MNTQPLTQLMEAYRNAPPEFRATSYWRSYEQDIVDEIARIDPNELRSGKYSILATMGFNDVIYYYHPTTPWLKKLVARFIREQLVGERGLTPYGVSIRDVREMSMRHCELVAAVTGAPGLENVEMSRFGNPADLFEIKGRPYSVQFLSYYVRYCFAYQHMRFRGDEIVVELGPGSGYQVEILKKLHPGLTVLCFDLPAQLFLCETYLTQALQPEHIVGSGQTIGWQDLSQIRKGHVHFLGNWQMPLLKSSTVHLFWNAASFGEMEPEIVKNYLGYVLGHATWVYLLQARHGKETSGKIHVQKPTTLADYQAMLEGYRLIEEHDAYLAHRRFWQSGGYFEALWKKL